MKITSSVIVRSLAGSLFICQLWLLYLIFGGRHADKDAFHDSINVAGYTLLGGLVSLATLPVVVVSQRNLRWGSGILVAAVAMVFAWGILFLLASVAV